MSLVWLPEFWVLALVVCGWFPVSCGVILLWTSFYSHLPSYVSRKSKMMKCSVSGDFSAPQFLFLCCQLFSCKRRKGQTSALKFNWIPPMPKDGTGNGVRACETGACLSAGPGGWDRQSRISSGLIRKVPLCNDQQRDSSCSECWGKEMAEGSALTHIDPTCSETWGSIRKREWKQGKIVRAERQGEEPWSAVFCVGHSVQSTVAQSWPRGSGLPGTGLQNCACLWAAVFWEELRRPSALLVNYWYIFQEGSRCLR